MRFFRPIIWITLVFLLPEYLHAQLVKVNVDSIFNRNGEIFFKFRIDDRNQLHGLTRMISLDNVRGKTVFAYANRQEYEQFLSTGIPFDILPSPGSLIKPGELNPWEGSIPEIASTVWDFYPNYTQYLDFMAGFASAHPEICQLDTVGTSIQGRLILVARISDNVGDEEAEPQFLYTSSIHGDELTGYVLMLHLIDYLLTNYGTDPDITDLINTTDIIINPLANPDGTFRGGNNSVYGAVRYNMNNIDLNRNFPDPKVGQHPDGNAWQPETVAWMEYAAAHHFSMSANFHGGAEVFNYPWDTWTRLHADDDWWQFTGREWVDTAHQYAPPGYYTLMNNGISNGNAWYEVNGGRQDYMNYWHHCREVTLEISDIKLLPVSQLLAHWDYNYRSFLNYMRQVNYGFNGIVTDTVTDAPLAAKIFIKDHDKDQSEVYSHLPSGFYARPIEQGVYDVEVSSPGYFTKTILNVAVSRYQTTPLDIQLRPLTYDAQDITNPAILVYPNPSDGIIKLDFPDAPVHPLASIQVINSFGEMVYSENLGLNPGDRSARLDLRKLAAGLYFLKFNTGYRIFIDKLIIR